ESTCTWPRRVAAVLCAITGEASPRPAARASTSSRREGGRLNAVNDIGRLQKGSIKDGGITPPFRPALFANKREWTAYPVTRQPIKLTDSGGRSAGIKPNQPLAES